MPTLYDDVINVFTNKITCYEWYNLIDIEIDKILDGYMISSCIKFRTCKIDLSDRDDDNRKFNNELNDEMIDIITEGMIVEWLKPILYNSDNMRSFLNTKELNLTSPQGVLSQIRQTYNECKIEFKKMVIEYSYNNNDVSVV